MNRDGDATSRSEQRIESSYVRKAPQLRAANGTSSHRHVRVALQTLVRNVLRREASRIEDAGLLHPAIRYGGAEQQLLPAALADRAGELVSADAEEFLFCRQSQPLSDAQQKAARTGERAEQSTAAAGNPEGEVGAYPVSVTAEVERER